MVLAQASGASWEYIMQTTRARRKTMFKAARAIADRRNSAIEASKHVRR